MGGTVFLFPGQGSQFVGMGKAFYEAHEFVRDLFQEASDIVGEDLAGLCFEGPADVLVQTIHAQPAITLVDIVCLRVLEREGVTPSAVAGHSLGEFAARPAAGVLSFGDTIRLLHTRGGAMQDAADRHPGGMVAVFGLDPDTLKGICADVAETGSVEIANHNSNTQVALTGEQEALKQASALAKQAGAKLVIPLKVSGAWHSRFMGSAQPVMRAVLETCEVGVPLIPVIANVTGRPHGAGETVDLLVDQLVSPVQWVRSMGHLIEEGFRDFVEVGPGKVLTGLLRDIDREVRATNVQDTDTLAKFKESLA